ncbi:MAG: HEPN domain-containing protein [Sedimentisphaerales bacterium]
MNEEVRLHLERADDCIKDAELLLSADRNFAAVGRGYYAMFHSATAALLHKGIKRHSHQGIISSFGREFIKAGQVEPRFHKYFTEAFDLRMESDYQPVVEITQGQAQKVVERAKEFIETCRKLCK